MNRIPTLIILLATILLAQANPAFHRGLNTAWIGRENAVALRDIQILNEGGIPTPIEAGIVGRGNPGFLRNIPILTEGGLPALEELGSNVVTLQGDGCGNARFVSPDIIINQGTTTLTAPDPDILIRQRIIHKSPNVRVNPTVITRASAPKVQLQPLAVKSLTTVERPPCRSTVVVERSAPSHADHIMSASARSC